MAQVDGNELPPASAKCDKYRKALSKQRIDLSATGSRENNALLSLLKCTCKENKKCDEALKHHAGCSSSVMGAGVFEGRPDCARELKALLKCANNNI